MTKARLSTSVMGTGVVLVGCLGCLSLNDLSSYSEGGTGVVFPPEQPSGGSAGAGQVSAPVAQGGSESVQTPAVEERDPTDVPLDPQPTDPAPTDPAPSDPTDPSPTVDPVDACDAAGEFTTTATSSCYLLGDATSSWRDARDACDAWGGDLVEIGSAEENLALRDRSDVDAWIGANDLDLEGTFVWAGGAPVEFAAWAFLQPDDNQGSEDCGELRALDDAWNDVPCTGNTQKRALCERQRSNPVE